MLPTDSPAVVAASRIIAERWSLSSTAAVAAVADIAAETGVDVEELAHLIVASVPGMLLEGTASSAHPVADATPRSAPLPSEVEARWDDFMLGLEQRVRLLGADGLSLGLANGSRVHTFNRGFSDRTSAMYATISAEAELPGPATLRSMRAQYFTSHEAVVDRYPKAVGIHAGTRFGAAACLPLVLGGQRAALGYLAVHYHGRRDFDEPGRAELRHAAEVTTREIHHLVGEAEHDDAAGEDRGPEMLRSELAGLRTAMRTRAEIEQAKGMLMERYGLNDARSWNLLRRISNETNLKVSVVARAVVHRGAVLGLPPGGTEARSAGSSESPPQR